MIDFEWYRSFISIYKNGTVSKAAESRYLTQPAMSQHLSALESEVGEPLFLRTPRKMVPTDKGKELYTLVAPILERLENITLRIKAPSLTEIPKVRLGAAPEYMLYRLLEYGESMGFRIIAQLGTAEQLLGYLQEDKVDFIITSRKNDVPGFSYVKLEVETFVLVAPMNYESPAGDIEEWLNLQPWLSYGLELPIIRRFWRQHFNKRPQWEPVHVIPDLRGILKGIESHMGMSLLPTYLIRESLSLGKTKVVFPDYTVENELYLAYRVKDKEHPNLQMVIEKLKSIIG